MTGIARNVRTGEICSAAERNVRDDIQGDAFTCIGCTAKMRPIAVTPGADYHVVPHFRVRPPHDDDCEGDGTEVAAARAERPGRQARRTQPGLMPTVLRLTIENPQAQLQAQPLDRVADRGHAVEGDDDEAPPRADHVARTIHRIAQCFLDLTDREDLPLTLPGCQPGTYRKRFERLRFPPRKVYERKVYYDAISFEDYKVDDETGDLDILLGPSGFRKDKLGNARVASRFRVHLDMHAWSASRRSGFLKDLRRARERQKAMKLAAADERIYLFFLGEQDASDATLFHVDDVRLACFLTGPA